MTHDMTTGSPMRLIVMFTIPLLIGNVFQQLYSMADTVIVGRTIGVQALAAVGATGPLCFLVLGFFFGFSSGVTVVTAQRFGAKDARGVRRSIAMATTLCTAISAAATIGSVILTRPLLRLMNTPEDIFDGSYAYLVVIFIGIGATVFYNLISGIIRALGDSRTPLIFLIIASILNIALDFIFILWFGMGVAGAAWATVISQLASGVWCLRFARRKYSQFQLNRQDWRFDWNFAWEHLRIALPMAFQFSITAIGVIVMQTVLNTFGSTAVAAFTAAAKIDQLAVQPGFSIGIAIATYAAQNYGAGLYRRIREGVNKCSLLSTVFAIFMGAAVIVFCPQFTRLFVGDGHPEVIPLVRTYMLTNGSCYVILGLLFVYRNALQGIGRAFVPMMAGASELVVRTVAAPVLGGAIGYVGVCLSNPLAWIGATIPLAIAYFWVIRRLTGRCIG